MTDEVKPEETTATPEPENEALQLKQELETLQTKANEYLEGWRRAQADIANQRRRHEREKSELEGQANARLLRQLLPVGDDFERALQSIPADLQENQWVSGITLIARKLKQVFETEGVQTIVAEPGTPFDPTVHEAVIHESVEGYEAGVIVLELQKGYKLGERVLRPAQVKVAA